jgi:predicted nucleotidyltransferase
MPAITNLIRLTSSSRKIDQIRERSLEAFVEKLEKSEEDNLLRIVLFGSVARGDRRTDSDIDVFVLVKEGKRVELRDRILDISIDIDLNEGECRTHLSPFVNTLEEYESGIKIGVPVLNYIKEEGVVLYGFEY